MWFLVVLTSSINHERFPDLIKTGDSRSVLFLSFFWFEVSAVNFLTHMYGVLQSSLQKEGREGEERKGGREGEKEE